ncbi:Subtilisin-like protease SBT1-5 [Nymphaea thermarum]|nr:Subtilisin-like protease SBT1-5 [Nymphaea thermarum]
MDHSKRPTSFSTHEEWHLSTLASLSSSSSLPSSAMEDRLLYTYTHAMHGFSARLTFSELAELENHPAHVASYPDSYGQLLTTYTPKFLGLSKASGIWPESSYGSDIIIGILDTGIWPESKSFDDHGLSPVPDRWKGRCENRTTFSMSLCNRKLIGARSFSKGLRASGLHIEDFDYDSPRDFDGHGTHTSSTAAGNYVDNVEYFGYAKGSAKGIAPAARVAIYKVVWSSDDDSSAATDVLAGIDQAIADGVDVMSLSLAFKPASPYYEDVIAIGALSAVRRGILVSCSAGNSGSSWYSVLNGAPWIMTVGAGTTDRSFSASLTLGNGFMLHGTSYFPLSIYIADLPLYYDRSNISKASCLNSSLEVSQVAGKVVLCDMNNQTNIFNQIDEVNRAGAAAGIFVGHTMLLEPDSLYIPSLVVQPSEADRVRQYASQTINATVKEMTFQITKHNAKPAPQVTYFSSRGPNPISPMVLKPDVLAPGKDVLAAWVPHNPTAKYRSDKLLSTYALDSGTSMSSPHVAAVAALVRSVHPDWSAAAIKSAIMTTAQIYDNRHAIIRNEGTRQPATPLDFGSGHVDPNRAMDPGLIYDLDFQDYVNFICTLDYTAKHMMAMLRLRKWECKLDKGDLNYPSFIAVFNKTDVPSYPKKKTFIRVLTNVGSPDAVYSSAVDVPKGMKVIITPSSLTFSERNNKQIFRLHLEVDEEALSAGQKGTRAAYGYLRWTDDKSEHIVSSPIVAIVH